MLTKIAKKNKKRKQWEASEISEQIISSTEHKLHIFRSEFEYT